MAHQSNKYRRDCDLVVVDHTQLCTEHLPLVSGLSRKLGSYFIGPYKVIEQINPVSFKLDLLPSWRMHPVFHCSQLKKAQAQFSATVFDVNNEQPFCPSAAASGKFEVEDLLDHCVCNPGQSSEWGFLVKWRGYPLQEASWKPRAHLTNAPAILALYLQCRGLRSFPRGR